MGRAHCDRTRARISAGTRAGASTRCRCEKRSCRGSGAGLETGHRPHDGGEVLLLCEQAQKHLGEEVIVHYKRTSLHGGLVSSSSWWNGEDFNNTILTPPPSRNGSATVQRTAIYLDSSNSLAQDDDQHEPGDDQTSCRRCACAAPWSSRTGTSWAPTCGTTSTPAASTAGRAGARASTCR